MPVQNYPGRVVATCERCVWAKGAIHNSIRYTIRHRFPVAQTQAYEGALKGPVVSRSPTTFAHDTQVPTHCVPRIQQRIPLRGPTVIIRTETSPFCFRSEQKTAFRFFRHALTWGETAIYHFLSRRARWLKSTALRRATNMTGAVRKSLLTHHLVDPFVRHPF